MDPGGPGLVGAGLVGIEAYHGSHDAATRTRYVRMAADLGVIVTGGSDFHGSGREGHTMGSSDVPAEATAALAAAHRKRTASL